MQTQVQPNVDSRGGAFVARQPILDEAGRLFGYELLYRAGAAATSCTEERDRAAARVCGASGASRASLSDISACVLS